MFLAKSARRTYRSGPLTVVENQRLVNDAKLDEDVGGFDDEQVQHLVDSNHAGCRARENGLTKYRIQAISLQKVSTQTLWDELMMQRTWYSADSM